MKLSDKRKKQIIKESFGQRDVQTVRDRIEKMNAKAKEGLGPDDFLFSLDPDAMIDSGIDTDQYFADEEERYYDDAREALAASLHSHAGQDLTHAGQDDNVIDIGVSDNDAEDMEKPLGRGGMVGMGRRASMRENKSFGLKEVMSSYMKKCQHLNECGCQMKSPFNAPEDEPQGYMLVQNLEKIAKKAGELTGVAKYTDDAEPWVESKINSAAEHIDAVYDYIKYGRDKKSDMHGEMVNEKRLRNSIRKPVLEQTNTSSTPGPTRLPRNGQLTPISAPAPAKPNVTAPAARRPVPHRAPVNAVQSCNLIFDPATQRSFINHLSRLHRGLVTNNPTVANYELRAHNASVTNVFGQYLVNIMSMFPGNFDGYRESPLGIRLSRWIGEVRNILTIPGVNRNNTAGDMSLYGWPQDISQINPRLRQDMLTRLQNAYNLTQAEMTASPSICELVAAGPPVAEEPPADTTSGETAAIMAFNK